MVEARNRYGNVTAAYFNVTRGTRALRLARDMHDRGMGRVYVFSPKGAVFLTLDERWERFGF
jgi:hypothetical protein